MKQVKQFAMVLSTLIIMGLFSNQVAAQPNMEEGQIAVNAGFAYGFTIEEPGLRVGATYFLSEDMRVGGDLTYWFVDSHAGVDFTYLEFNGNFNYLFHKEDELIIYGIGTLGIHYADVSSPQTEWGGGSYSDTELGLGIGGGIEYSLGGFSIFAEPKLFLTGFDQLKFNVGARFYL